MTTTNVIERFASLQLTSQLPVEAREALAKVSYLRRFAADEELCREGCEATEFYLIDSGRVGLDMFVPGRGQVRILTLGPGEVLAWSALVGNHGATATATALEDTLTVAFPDKALSDLCEANVSVGYFVMKELAKTIARRLLSTRLQLLDLFADQPGATVS